MVNVTSPDNIPMWQLADAASLTQESQTQGAAIQVALNKRQRYDFVWPTSTERTAQTGMVQGSRGYQVDTKSEYIYDNSAWRLWVPYAEFTSSSMSVGNTGFVTFGALTIDTSNSTSTTFATATGTFNNGILLTDPGIYSFSSYAIADAAMGAVVAYQLMSASSDPNISASQLMRGPFASDNVSGLSMPFYRTTASNQIVYFYYRQASAGTKNISARIRVGRLA